MKKIRSVTKTFKGNKNGRKLQMKYKLHYGKCRMCCCLFDLETRSQDIFTSAAQIWTVLFLICLLQIQTTLWRRNNIKFPECWSIKTVDKHPPTWCQTNMKFCMFWYLRQCEAAAEMFSPTWWSESLRVCSLKHKQETTFMSSENKFSHDGKCVF